ncbi:hypothetical protein BWP24_26430 (plasmid) [Vibrio campbellii]|nr:hypothetical protein BWP24_26430 [Vibrio campbellii]
MFISDKVSSMTKLQPNTVIRAALDLLNEVGVDGLTTRKLSIVHGMYQGFARLKLLVTNFLSSLFDRGLPSKVAYQRNITTINALLWQCLYKKTTT